MKQIIILFILVLTVSIIKGQQVLKQDLTLNDAIEIALNNNPGIKSAREEINSAKGRFWSGISLPSPELVMSYEYIPLNTGLNNFGERTIEVSQSFDFPSNYFLKGSKFNLQEDIALYRLKKAEIILQSQVKSAYFNILAKKEQLKIAEENIIIAEDFANKADIRYSVGEGTNLERLTAKVNYTEALNNLEVSKNGLRTAYAELNFVLGKGNQSDDIIKLSDSLSFNSAFHDKISFDELYKQSLSVNPQIKISELNLNQSAVERSLAWSSLLPGFNLAYYRQNLDGNNGFYGASFGVTVPLWFIFGQRGEIQEASANENIAESELESIKNEIYLKIKSSFIEYENSFRQVNIYRNDIIPQAEEVYRSASASYNAGEITYIEFLQARQTIINANSNYINVLFDYYKSIFTLEENIGSSLIFKN